MEKVIAIKQEWGNLQKRFPQLNGVTLMLSNGVKQFGLAGVKDIYYQSFLTASKAERLRNANWYYIKISKHPDLLANASIADCVDTVRHEAAHILDYMHRGDSGHDSVWKSWAVKVGAKPNRTHMVQANNSLKKPEMICQISGKVINVVYRQTKEFKKGVALHKSGKTVWTCKCHNKPIVLKNI